MIFKIFKSQKSQSKKNHGGRAAAIYLIGDLKKCNPKTNWQCTRDGARLLRGNPHRVIQLAESLEYKNKHTVGCLSFSESDLTQETKDDIMNGFEQAFFAGLPDEQTQKDEAIFWVEHTDKGRVELNFFIVNVDIATGKSYNPYYHNADKNLFRFCQSLYNAKHGLTDPDDPNNAQTTTINNRLPQNKKELKQTLNDYITLQISTGNINNRDDVITALSSLGIEIARTTKKSISIKDPDGGQNIRLAGTYYDETSDFNRKDPTADASHPEGAGKLLDTVLTDDQADYRSELAKRIERNTSRYRTVHRTSANKLNDLANDNQPSHNQDGNRHGSSIGQRQTQAESGLSHHDHSPSTPNGDDGRRGLAVSQTPSNLNSDSPEKSGATDTRSRDRVSQKAEEITRRHENLPKMKLPKGDTNASNEPLLTIDRLQQSIDRTQRSITNRERRALGDEREATDAHQSNRHRINRLGGLTRTYRDFDQRLRNTTRQTTATNGYLADLRTRFDCLQRPKANVRNVPNADQRVREQRNELKEGARTTEKHLQGFERQARARSEEIEGCLARSSELDRQYRAKIKARDKARAEAEKQRQEEAQRQEQEKDLRKRLERAKVIYQGSNGTKTLDWEEFKAFAVDCNKGRYLQSEGLESFTHFLGRVREGITIRMEIDMQGLEPHQKDQLKQGIYGALGVANAPKAKFEITDSSQKAEVSRSRSMGM